MKASAAPRITCEKCGDKIETQNFVEHIRLCVGNRLDTATLSASATSATSAESRTSRSSPSPLIKSEAAAAKSPAATGSDAGPPAAANDGAPSVLNALEKLIEKSFDPQSKRGANAVGSNILRRLGIDEGKNPKIV